MVQRSHTAGWLPQMYEPLRKLRERVADWFATQLGRVTGQRSKDVSSTDLSSSGCKRSSCPCPLVR